MIRILILLMLIVPASSHAGTATDYLIMQDIGQYKFMGKGGGQGSGVISAAGHFNKDHTDESYGCMYFNEVDEIGVNAEVTQHAASDSDKWLLHEVERGFRFGDFEEEMTPSRFRNLDGNNIFYTKLGGGTYRWISNNVVVAISYTDLYQQKSEPLEIVKAYLTKFPSTIPAMTIDKAHSELWLKDEMERRLWLSDKWFNQLDLQKAELTAALKEVVKHLDVFLKYREKYYGVAAKTDRILLHTYSSQNNAASLKEKLKEYQLWWSQNKSESINLP